MIELTLINKIVSIIILVITIVKFITSLIEPMIYMSQDLFKDLKHTSFILEVNLGGLYYCLEYLKDLMIIKMILFIRLHSRL